MININFILKMIFQMLGAQCDHITITKSKKTLAAFGQYWNQIMDLIGARDYNGPCTVRPLIILNFRIYIQQQ